MISLTIIGKPKQNNEKSMKLQFRLGFSKFFQLFQIFSNFLLCFPIFQCFKRFGPILDPKYFKTIKNWKNLSETIVFDGNHWKT